MAALPAPGLPFKFQLPETLSYKILIVDDEKHARLLLEGMVRDYAPDMELVGSCADLDTAVAAIRVQQPDLVLLDIEMPGHSGLELFRHFPEDEPGFAVIFTTAYNQYAIHALRLSAIDYLLKPIEPEALELALERFRKRSQRQRFDHLQQNLLPENEKRIALHTAGHVRFPRFSEIISLQGDGAYTRFRFSDESILLVSRNLKHFEELLRPDDGFYRCHKSWLINLSHASHYDRSDGGALVMDDGSRVSVSQEKTRELFQLLEKR